MIWGWFVVTSKLLASFLSHIKENSDSLTNQLFKKVVNLLAGSLARLVKERQPFHFLRDNDSTKVFNGRECIVMLWA